MGRSVARLGEVTRVVGGATPDTGVSEYWNGKVLWATPADLSHLDGQFISDTLRKITQAGLRSCAAEVLPRESVLFSSRAPIGHVAINLEPMATNQGFKSFIPDRQHLEPKYLYWWLRSNRRYLQSIGNGATFKEVSKAVVSQIEFPLPPLDEQRRIAIILDQADDLRRKRRLSLEHLDSLAHAIFLKVFGDLRANAHGYDIAKLGDIADVRDGTHDSPKYVESGYPLVTSKNLTSGYIDLQDARPISEADFNAINRRSKVKKGDILMPMIGTIGSPVLVEQEPSFAIKNVALLKFADGSPLNIFVLWALKGKYFDDIISRQNRGGTQKFVSLGDIRSFPLPVPPLGHQEQFSRGISCFGETKAAAMAHLTKLEELFESLMHCAFEHRASLEQH